MENASYSMAHANTLVKLQDFHAMLPWRRERWDNGGKFCHSKCLEHTNGGKIEVPQTPVCSVRPCELRILAYEHKSFLTRRTMRSKYHKGSELSVVLSHFERFSYRQGQCWDTLPMTPSGRLDCAVPD